MPPLGTPFRLPSSRPQSSSRRPQFASTPRFLLSQTTPGKSTQDIADSIDPEDGNSSLQATPFATARTKRGRDTASASRQKDAIEDSDDGLDALGGNTRSKDSDDIDINSSPPEQEESGLFDDEFEDLFGPTPAAERAKRRRVSAEPTATTTPSVPRPADAIAPSPPEGQIQAHRQSHSPSTPTNQAQPPPSSSFRSQPRFRLLASNHPPSSSQFQQSQRPPQQPSTAHNIPPNTPLLQSTSPPLPQRRKPNFVLPHHNTQTEEDPADDPTIPTPFSPSSKALRRRGRPRAADGPSYLPGGMAAEVRSWILEMGAKREQQQKRSPTLNSHSVDSSSSTPALDLSKYALTLSIHDARRSAVGSSGPMTFATGRSVVSLSESGSGADDSEKSRRLPVLGDDDDIRRVLLFGPPRSRLDDPSARVIRSRVPDLRCGNVVGVCKGLVWEVEVGELGLDLGGSMEGEREEVRVEEGVGCDAETVQEAAEKSASANANKAKWLVGMEWDLLL